MRARIENELLEWMREEDWTDDDDRFERIALELFRVQVETCRPYALLCRSLDRSPENVRRIEDIPAVPTGAFKEFELRCFEKNETVRVFRTSGTSTEKRGSLYLDRLDLYEASLLSSLRRTLLPGWKPGEARMRILAPDPLEAPESSLSCMFGALLDAEGGEGSGFDLHEGSLDFESLSRAITEARGLGEPMLIAGTAFAFVHLLDHCAGVEGAEGSSVWTLPPGSRVMETGGFKGRSREIPRDTLHALLGNLFGLPPERILNQYGMTELGSQFYDSTLIDPRGPRRKLAPPWTRVRFLDPDTGEDVAPGEVGMILIHDLANTGSVAAIQTADLGRAVLDTRASASASGNVIGFDVLGRAQGAEARGCSIATDVMLEASRAGGR